MTLTSKKFWDDSQKIEDLTYRLLSGDQGRVPPRLKRPQVDLEIPSQLTQLELFLRRPQTNRTAVPGYAAAIGNTPSKAIQYRAPSPPSRSSPVGKNPTNPTPSSPAQRRTPESVKKTSSKTNAATQKVMSAQSKNNKENDGAQRQLFKDPVPDKENGKATPRKAENNTNASTKSAPHPAISTKAPKEQPVVKFSEELPANSVLHGSRREKLEPTIRRLKNQKPFDPDFVFGGRNFEVPLSRIFSNHKSVMMHMGPDPRGKSGDWAGDRFDAQEEYEYKMAAKFIHICAHDGF